MSEVEWREGGKQRGQFGGRDAVFGLLVAELDLDQDGKRFAQSGGRGVEPGGNLE